MSECAAGSCLRRQTTTCAEGKTARDHVAEPCARRGLLRVRWQGADSAEQCATRQVNAPLPPALKLLESGMITELNGGIAHCGLWPTVATVHSPRCSS
jgi:hypothetical protein